MRRNTIFWGIVLLLLGGTLLLYNLGIISVNVWGLFFSLFLIILGIWILVSRFWKPAKPVHFSLPLDGATRAIVRIKHGAGRIKVSSGAGAGLLIDGDFGNGVHAKPQRNADTLDVELSPDDVGFPWFSDRGLDWTFALPVELPLELYMDSGANDVVFDLSNLRVTFLKINSGASSTQVNLPTSAGQTRVEIETGAASVVLRVPPEVAARIRGKATLGSLKINTARFPQSGSEYLSSNYDSASNKVDISFQTGVGSIEIM